MSQEDINNCKELVNEPFAQMIKNPNKGVMLYLLFALSKDNYIKQLVDTGKYNKYYFKFKELSSETIRLITCDSLEYLIIVNHADLQYHKLN